MAEIKNEIVAITISRLVRDASKAPEVVTADTLSQLEEIISELVGSGVIVEAAKVE